MDALTTSSADHRGTGPDSGRSSDESAAPRTDSHGTDSHGTDSHGTGQAAHQDDWGWFAPTKPRSTMEPHQRVAEDEQPAVSRRKVSPIRPVGKHSKPRPDVTVPGRASVPTGEYRADDTPSPAQGAWLESAPAAAPEQPAAPPQPAAPQDMSPAPGLSVSSEAGASSDAILLRRTMAVIEPVADKATSYFYALLFLQHPELRSLFPAAMDVQRGRIFKALLTAAKYVDNPGVLTEYLSNLGRGHRKYGTRPEHYPAVGECLIGALTYYAYEIWNDEVEAAWVRAYTTISQIMIDSAVIDERTAPPWWDAEIVSHERRTRDIAVITVRPDRPYPFLAGQYTSLETPWWPRVWRHYSFASAPRPDGLLSFHVKAVPAGWVSSALVNRARPGDVIRLGSPTGSMIVDHSTDNGLLCLGGGTGIAPIKAMIEDVAEHGCQRAIEVFYGARNDHDLYDLDIMQRLEQRHSWLSVRPVVSDRLAGELAGHLPEMVRKYGPWYSYDAYLSGPPGMIRSSVDALVSIGMPYDRIRHDSFEEFVVAGD
jgi:NAD(P)H-flavin reductase/hemoglobin-like flavoprotein